MLREWCWHIAVWCVMCVLCVRAEPCRAVYVECVAFMAHLQVTTEWNEWKGLRPRAAHIIVQHNGYCLLFPFEIDFKWWNGVAQSISNDRFAIFATDSHTIVTQLWRVWACTGIASISIEYDQLIDYAFPSSSSHLFASCVLLRVVRQFLMCAAHVERWNWLPFFAY